MIGYPTVSTPQFGHKNSNNPAKTHNFSVKLGTNTQLLRKTSKNSAKPATKPPTNPQLLRETPNNPANPPKKPQPPHNNSALKQYVACKHTSTTVVEMQHIQYAT